MRVATFNVENLVHRYRFAKGVRPDRAAANGFSSEDLRFRLADPDSKRIAAEVIVGLNADVIALQEVEGLDILKQFRDAHLGGRAGYPFVMLIDGNDERKIDVAVLSRFPIVHARSWQHLSNGHGPLFSRDCLEVDVQAPDAPPVTLYVNHFKSMRAEGHDGNGRELTRPTRERQSRAVTDLIRDRYGDDAGEAPFIVLGDLNDYPEDDEQGSCGIRPLLDWEHVVDVSHRIAPSERWTHFWKGLPRAGLSPKYRQLDYILPSHRIARLNPGPPRIDRRGMPRRAERYSGLRYEGIGWDHPKASDHCPVVFDVERW